jgi:hypothetical protein
MTEGARATLLPTTCAGPVFVAAGFLAGVFGLLAFFGAGFAFFALFGSTTFGAAGFFASGEPPARGGAGVTGCGTVVVEVLEVPECEDPLEALSVASCLTPFVGGAGVGVVPEPSSVAVWSVPAVSAPAAAFAIAARPAAVRPPPAIAESAARRTRRRGLEGAMRRVRSSSVWSI